MDLAHVKSLPDIYDAAINLGRWRRAFDQVAEASNAKAVMLLIRAHSKEARDLRMLNSTYLDFSRGPSGLYYGLRYARLQNPDWDFLSEQAVHSPIAATRLGISSDELDQRGDYAFLRRKLGVRRRLGYRLNDDCVWFDGVSLGFDSAFERAPEQAMANFSFFLPHITKAVVIGRVFRQLHQRYRAALAALDHVHIGLAIAKSSGDVIVKNAAAERILDENPNLSLAANMRLRSVSTKETGALADAIRLSADTAKGDEARGGQLMTISDGDASKPLLLDVSPLRDSKGELEPDLDGALITIIDTSSVPKLKIERFGALYGLTTAEVEVLRLFFEGHSTEEIAEMRDTTPVTTKNQMAAVLAKTGVKRRSELIRLVVRVLPPID